MELEKTKKDREQVWSNDIENLRFYIWNIETERVRKFSSYQKLEVAFRTSKDYKDETVPLYNEGEWYEAEVSLFII